MIIGALSHEQARHFAAQGYYRLPEVYSPDELLALRTFVLHEAEKEGLADASDGTAMKMYGLYDRNPSLMHDTVTHPKLIGALQSLLGPNVIFVKNRHNHATVNNHRGEPAEGLHRDILQPTRGLITASILLEESSIENGATRIIPGSHFLPNVGAPQKDGGGTWMADHAEFDGMDDQAVQVPMPAGSVLLFNGLVFHGVGANASGKTRTSITLGFRSVDELEKNQGDHCVLVAGENIYRGNDR